MDNGIELVCFVCTVFEIVEMEIVRRVKPTLEIRNLQREAQQNDFCSTKPPLKKKVS